MVDVLVLGAGLAGLAAARDLARRGVDVLVLEARPRPGGRVEQTELADGRVMQLGGEVVGPFHTAYLGLAEELGLTVVPSFVADPGETTWGLADGVYVGDEPPWQTARERADAVRVDALFGELVAGVDPDDPWSHPDAARLDRLSVAGWLRSVHALPAVVRQHEAGQLALAADSFERTSLLSELRKAAASGVRGFYDYETWESLRVAEGSATVALRMAAELGERLRLGAAAVAVAVDRRGATVRLAGGEELRAAAVVCALPAGPLREVAIDGVSEPRLRSLRRQRHALAAKICVAYAQPFWRARGANGLAASEGFLGSTWPQSEAVLATLVPPERLAAHLAAPPDARREGVYAELERLYGEGARDSVAYEVRDWGVDPFTRGYITSWAPGDVLAVGPLHGRHEPPFYVAGSDHWVAGYMEGAVRTGRAAAAALLDA